MKITVLITLTLSAFFSLAQNSDNLELQKNSVEFEQDHSAWRIDRTAVKKRDSIRQKRADEILKVAKSPTSNDYANAALVFSRINDPIADAKMLEYMTKAVELDPTRNKSLLANGIDRMLIHQEKPQIYGTQAYLSMNMETMGQSVMYEVDSTQVSDAQRIEYGVRTLSQEREHLKFKSKQLLLGLMIDGMSVVEIMEFCKKEIKENPSSKFVTEGQIYRFTGALSRAGASAEAQKIHELWIQLYPNSFNAFDVLGDFYFSEKNYEKGVAAYERSLEINPNKEYAREKIEEYKNR